MKFYKINSFNKSKILLPIRICGAFAELSASFYVRQAYRTNRGGRISIKRSPTWRAKHEKDNILLLKNACHKVINLLFEEPAHFLMGFFFIELDFIPISSALPVIIYCWTLIICEYFFQR